jgi:hypothetical protein
LSGAPTYSDDPFALFRGIAIAIVATGVIGGVLCVAWMALRTVLS